MDIEHIMKQLTLEEKVKLLEGADRGFTNAIERLDIPRILMVDGPHGCRVVKGTKAEDGKPYTMHGEMEDTMVLPCEAAMSSTWNPDLIEQAGKAVGEECRQYGISMLLGPGANGKRSPLGGRNFEYYSEDPYVSGTMATAFINGLQSRGVGACIKHFALNEQETRRTSCRSHADERTKREIYYRPFEMAIKNAKPWAVMSSYNRVDEEYASENEELLQNVLREDFGFDGLVVSDWNAVNHKIRAVKSGLSLQMPGPSNKMEEVMEAVRQGELSEQEINDRVLEVLTFIDRAMKNRQEMVIDREANHKLAQRIAEEGSVLLRNENHLLPLRKGSRIAVLGESAKKPMFSGAGSSSQTTEYLDIPLDKIAEFADVAYAAGYEKNETTERMLGDVRKVSQDADVVLIFVDDECAEGIDRTDLLLPEAQERVIRVAAEVNQNLILVSMCGSVVQYVDLLPYVKSILHVWNAGEGCGSAIANILFGEVNPSGKLTETFPLYLENNPSYGYFPGFLDDSYYSEGLLTGYRFYDTKKIKPLYAFGHGLSYTTFEYRNLQVSTDQVGAGENLTVKVDVTNTGNVFGKETVQLYVSDLKSYMMRPEKELKAYAKVALEPGETRTVEMELDESAFSYYLPHLKKFAVEKGEFVLLIGAASDDIRLRKKIYVDSETEVRLPLTKENSFKDFLEDDRYSQAAEAIMKMLHMEKSGSFYQLLMGSSLDHTKDLLDYFDPEHQRGSMMCDCLINRNFPIAK